jgi:hypothetical protein
MQRKREGNTMAIEWFYLAKGRQMGPVTTAELCRLADTGNITPDTLVCRSTTTHVADVRWVRAAKVQGLFSAKHIQAMDASVKIGGEPSDNRNGKRNSVPYGLIFAWIWTILLGYGLFIAADVFPHGPATLYPYNLPILAAGLLVLDRS